MVPHSLYSLQNTFSNIVHRNDCLVLLYTLAFYGLPLLAVSSCLCEKIQIIDLDKEKNLRLYRWTLYYQNHKMALQRANHLFPDQYIVLHIILPLIHSKIGNLFCLMYLNQIQICMFALQDLSLLYSNFFNMC